MQSSPQHAQVYTGLSQPAEMPVTGAAPSAEAEASYAERILPPGYIYTRAQSYAFHQRELTIAFEYATASSATEKQRIPDRVSQCTDRFSTYLASRHEIATPSVWWTVTFWVIGAVTAVTLGPILLRGHHGVSARLLAAL